MVRFHAPLKRLPPTTSKKAATSGVNKKPTRSAKTKSSTAKKTPLSSLLDTIVEVLVGPDLVKYSIHRGLLCHRSAYFKAALTGRFKEARQGTVTLEDEDPQVFSLFTTWLYTGSCKKDDGDTTLEIGTPLQLWLFAEKRLVPELQNTIIDQLIQSYPTESRYSGRLQQKELSAEAERACISAWNNSEEGSRLRTFIVDFFLLRLDLEKLFGHGRASSFPSALIIAIAVRAQKTYVIDDDFLGALGIDHCFRYHVHDPDHPPCKKLKELTDEGSGDDD